MKRLPSTPEERLAAIRELCDRIRRRARGEVVPEEPEPAPEAPPATPAPPPHAEPPDPHWSDR